jgi:hypothetical protein
MSELMTKWTVDVMSGDPFEGTSMIFYADDAELLNPVPVRIVTDKVDTIISHTLEITANGAKFNFGIPLDEGFFTRLEKVNE